MQDITAVEWLTEVSLGAAVTEWHSSWQKWFLQVSCRPQRRPHDFDTASLHCTKLVCHSHS